MTNGVLMPQYEVHCYGCEEPNLGLASTQKRAESVLDSMEWKKVGGFWHCPSCAARALSEDSK